MDGVAPLLGLAFTFLGGLKLNAPETSSAAFTAWGLSPALVPWAGAVEAALGLAIFHGPTRRFGAAGLGVWMLGATAVHLRAGQLAAAAVPAAVLALAAAVAWSGFRFAPHRPFALPAPLRNPPRGAAGFGLVLQLVGVSFLIRWIVGGVVFWSALPLLALAHARREGVRGRRGTVGLILLYLLVLGLGVSGIWGFVGHFFLSDDVAASIGWASGSPFQHELAFYHLGMGVAGLLCLWIRDRFWLAAGLTPSIFALGAGWVHLREFVRHGNTAPANWGIGVLFGNFVIPTAVVALLLFYGRLGGWTHAERDVQT